MPFVIGTLNSTQVVGLLLSKYLREVAFPSPVQRQFLGRRPTASPRALDLLGATARCLAIFARCQQITTRRRSCRR